MIQKNVNVPALCVNINNNATINPIEMIPKIIFLIRINC